MGISNRSNLKPRKKKPRPFPIIFIHYLDTLRNSKTKHQGLLFRVGLQFSLGPLSPVLRRLCGAGAVSAAAAAAAVAEAAAAGGDGAERRGVQPLVDGDFCSLRLG